MQTPSWEHFEHQADIGVRGYGRTPDEAFEQAAMAMMAVMADLDTIELGQEVAVTCRAADAPLLLVDWLNAVIYEVATRSMLFGRFSVRVDGVGLTGRMWGEKIVPERHRPAVEIKGATYSALKLAQTEDGVWVAQCVVDV